MRMIGAVLALAVLLIAQGFPRAEAQSLPQPQTQGSVTFISGGIGGSSQQLMQSAEKDYSLHLLFAQSGTGAYLADVPVQIVDGSGATMVNAVSAGPFFYAKLKPGHYTVVATQSGKPITKMADVPADGAVDLYFYWP